MNPVAGKLPLDLQNKPSSKSRLKATPFGPILRVARLLQGIFIGLFTIDDIVSRAKRQ